MDARFTGGKRDPTDFCAQATAVREMTEETAGAPFSQEEPQHVAICLEAVQSLQHTSWKKHRIAILSWSHEGPEMSGA